MPDHPELGNISGCQSLCMPEDKNKNEKHFKFEANRLLIIKTMVNSISLNVL